MFYTQLRVSCNPAYAEILIAEFSEIGFDTFLETDGGFDAYSEAENYDKDALHSVIERYSPLAPIELSVDRIQKRNWNAEWEKNYEPIDVDSRCLIRAEFHRPKKKYEYEIIITPRMSFGTGHHQTTYLMIRNQLMLDHSDKRVMDAGCGTAILSIMAAKLGAKEVEAFDIDDWSVDNAQDNIKVNDSENIRIQKGKIAELDFAEPFDIILANINRNVLLDEIRNYSDHLQKGGHLLISGFYAHDIQEILREAQAQGLTETRRDDKDDWACLLLVKK